MACRVGSFESKLSGVPLSRCGCEVVWADVMKMVVVRTVSRLWMMLKVSVGLNRSRVLRWKC